MTEEQVELAREAKNRYQREWRARNRDRVRESNMRYWAKIAAAEKEVADGSENANDR